ncbi:MAG: (2Fe-2S) ferredoxin domain-containing protein [Clostridia bacterium]|nr:(2Fe-2S) ferredoxin domain-containing protein [Clostridia bacterium]
MKSIAEINAIRDKMQSQIKLRDNSKTEETHIVIGMGTCGIKAGAVAVFNAFVDEVALKQIAGVKVMRSGCMGKCDLEPMVEVTVPGKEKVTYINVDEKKAKEIIEKHILNGKAIDAYLMK